MASGDIEVVPAPQPDSSALQDELDNEQEALQRKVPVLEKAILMLVNDSELCDDMAAQINRNLLLQEYRKQQPAFAEALTVLKPQYMECLRLSRQLNMSSDETVQLNELIKQQFAD